MRELAILTFVTVDGVMQSPTSPQEDPSGGFAGGGWAAPYWDEVMAQVRTEAMAVPYDFLFGRKTYDLFAAHWTRVSDEDPVARRMNEAKKYVATASATHALPWNNSTRVTGDVSKQIARLKNEDGRLLQVHGSGDLIQTLLAHDLIDEYRLWTFPVCVGSGRRLFARGTPPASLSLRKTDVTSNGVVMGIYRRAGSA